MVLKVRTDNYLLIWINGSPVYKVYTHRWDGEPLEKPREVIFSHRIGWLIKDTGRSDYERNK